MIYHVSTNGCDTAAGTLDAPFRTINRAAAVAAPGDTVQVHAGQYREWVDPQQGGSSEDCRITYEAAAGEHVIIKGSEIVTDWEHVEGTIWKKVLPNTMFGDFNPYATPICGDWIQLPKDYDVHQGDVYINGVSMFEASSLEDLYAAPVKTKVCSANWRFTPEEVLHPELTIYLWYAQVNDATTTLLCNFQQFDPNKELIEINVRMCCFYPRKSGLNYITVRGFEMAHAAPPWSPPTADQPGLIGPHWSKGWIIENNHIHDAKCCGISLGKDAATGDNISYKTGRKSGHMYQLEAVFSGLRAGWDKAQVGSHIVRNNEIHDCGQNAIVGHMGGAFSCISHNHIYNIAVKHEFYGAEIAGIKLHAAIDAQIIGNNIHHCTKGTWLDWQAQGVRLSKNVYHHNDRDLMIEVSHGPCTVDNNIFLSEFFINNESQGTALVHNLVCGLVRFKAVLSRTTPYHLPHSTQVAGISPVYGGDDRVMNNLFAGMVPNKGEPYKAPTNLCETYDIYSTPDAYWNHITSKDPKVRSLEDYRDTPQPVWIEENAYSGYAKPSTKETGAISAEGILATITEKNGKWELTITVPESVACASCQSVTTERLGTPRITEQSYTNPDGSAIDFATDICHNQRDINIIPGPFAKLSAGTQTIVVWEK